MILTAPEDNVACGSNSYLTLGGRRPRQRASSRARTAATTFLTNTSSPWRFAFKLRAILPYRNNESCFSVHFKKRNIDFGYRISHIEPLIPHRGVYLFRRNASPCRRQTLPGKVSTKRSFLRRLGIRFSNAAGNEWAALRLFGVCIRVECCL